MRVSHVVRIKLDAQGYDRDGKYWGVGQPLFFCSDAAEVDPTRWFETAYCRATDAVEASSIFSRRLGKLVMW